MFILLDASISTKSTRISSFSSQSFIKSPWYEPRKPVAVVGIFSWDNILDTFIAFPPGRVLSVLMLLLKPGFNLSTSTNKSTDGFRVTV